MMERCTRKDGPDGGCVRIAGHQGRCKVRSEPDTRFAADGHPAGDSRPGGRKNRRAGGDGQEQVQAEIDHLLATVATAADYLGLRKHPRADGYMLENAANGKMLLVTAHGNLVPVTITFETALAV